MVTTSRKTHSRKSIKTLVVEIVNSLEWLIVAFILALFFRAFVMEAFRIPTGSMADTLRGDHFRLRCRQCGYRFNYGIGGFNSHKSHNPGRPAYARCPSCGYYQPVNGKIPPASGDRILVLKCIYQFTEPRRWDVVVFKNPREPTINYIKRLVGKPGETVSIIDGDVYINGEIARKPAELQKCLWMVVYDNDYRPVDPAQGRFNGHIWSQPFRNSEGSNWVTGSEDNPVSFTLNSPSDKLNYLVYDSSVGNDFKAAYAYNDPQSYAELPFCSDLMLRFNVSFKRPDDSVGISLTKHETTYRGEIEASGKMVISSSLQEKPLAEKTLEIPEPAQPALCQFEVIDNQLILRFGAELLTYDLGPLPEIAAVVSANHQPGASIFGAGRLELSHIALFKDIHYTIAKHAGIQPAPRATQSNPFTLEEGEYFVLGDNSPNSEDSRWWSVSGKGNNFTFYRAGVVPHNYLVGKAVFVYWPGGFKPFRGFPVSVIPNVGEMRPVYGGSNHTYGRGG